MYPAMPAQTPTMQSLPRSRSTVRPRKEFWKIRKVTSAAMTEIAAWMIASATALVTCLYSGQPVSRRSAPGAGSAGSPSGCRTSRRPRPPWPRKTATEPVPCQVRAVPGKAHEPDERPRQAPGQPQHLQCPALDPQAGFRRLPGTRQFPVGSPCLPILPRSRGIAGRAEVGRTGPQRLPGPALQHLRRRGVDLGSLPQRVAPPPGRARIQVPELLGFGHGAPSQESASGPVDSADRGAEPARTAFQERSTARAKARSISAERPLLPFGSTAIRNALVMFSYRSPTRLKSPSAIRSPSWRT